MVQLFPDYGKDCIFFAYFYDFIKCHVRILNFTLTHSLSQMLTKNSLITLSLNVYVIIQMIWTYVMSQLSMPLYISNYISMPLCYIIDQYGKVIITVNSWLKFNNIDQEKH